MGVPSTRHCSLILPRDRLTLLVTVASLVGPMLAFCKACGVERRQVGRLWLTMDDPFCQAFADGWTGLER